MTAPAPPSSAQRRVWAAMPHGAWRAAMGGGTEH